MPLRGSMLWLYVRLFVVAAVPFGVVMAGVMSVFGHVQDSLWAGLLAGVVYGLLMSAVLGTIHGHAVRRLGERPTTTSSAEATIHVPLDPTTAMSRCAGALAELSGASSVTRDGDKAWTTTGMSAASFGERVECVFAADSSGTTIHVLSNSIRKWTLLDYGKNRQNVNAVVAALKGAG